MQGKWPTAEEERKITEIVEKAAADNTFGFDHKVDPKIGEPIQQGHGAPGHETGNHFLAIRRYEGQAAYEAAVRELWKRDPKRAEKLRLPKLSG